jgi:hypothetical protein
MPRRPGIRFRAAAILLPLCLAAGCASYSDRVAQLRPELVQGEFDAALQTIEKTRHGLDRIEIGSDERIFPVEVCCARCNRSLMDHEVYVEGYPSVRVTISFGRKHGWLRLSSLYGSYTIDSQHEIPEDTIANFFCPHCHAELAGAADCPLCSAPMVPLIVRDGGMVQICSRRGCRSHRLDISGTF